MDRPSFVWEASMSIDLNRRRAIAGIATSIGVFAAAGRAQEPGAQGQPAEKQNDPRTSIHYDLEIAAPPQRLYTILLDQKLFSAFSGMPATIDPSPGGTFSLFSGMIGGRNVELVANQRIVQAWRPASWDPGVYSMIHFELRQRAGGTALAFDHTGFPAGDYNHLDWGWHNHYWGPLMKFLA
jgi:activator of HSP90 ATPase